MFKKSLILLILILNFCFIDLWFAATRWELKVQKDAEVQEVEEKAQTQATAEQKKADDAKTAAEVKNREETVIANNEKISVHDKKIAEQQAILDKTPSDWKAQKEIYKAASSKWDLLRENANLHPDAIKHDNAKWNLKNAQISKIKASSARYDIKEKLCKWIKDCPPEKYNTDPAYKEADKKYNEAVAEVWTKEAELSLTEGAAKEVQDAANEEIVANAKVVQEAKDAYDDSDKAEWDITSRWYQINVNDISPGMEISGKTTQENVNIALATIIQNLMVALWSLALLIMTIWAWYIVLHHGQDELLSKWKSIFMSWVIALVVALSSYYLINIIRFILFQW